MLLRKPVFALALSVVGVTCAYGWSDQLTFKKPDKVGYFDIQCNIGSGNYDFTGYKTGSLGFDDDGHHTDLFGAGGFDCVCADIPHVINDGDHWDCDVKDSWDSGNGKGIKCAGSIVGWVGDHICQDDLGKLTSDEACGLQLAVWEAIYDCDDPTHLNENQFKSCLRSGEFKTTSSITTSVLNDAWNYYKSGFNADDNCIYVRSTDRGGQDQFKCNPCGGHGQVENTPEPFSMSLGFAGVGLFIRRRFRKKTSR